MDLRHLDVEALLERAIHDRAAEAELQRRYGARGAVLVIDFSDMVGRSDADGVIYALALARAAERAMHAALAPGRVVKRVADTLFVLFESAPAALAAAFAAHARLHAFNLGRDGRVGDGTRNDPIHASMGLGAGDLLVLPATDLYGAEVNRAFVLGEDVARRGEVLCSSGFLEVLGALPVGVGAFRAPAEREEEAGFPFHVLADYRGAAEQGRTAPRTEPP